MASGLEIVFPVVSVFDIQSADKAMADMQSALSRKATTIKFDISAQHGQSLMEQLGGGAKFAEMIDQAATGAGKLTATYNVIKDAQGKVLGEAAVREVRTFKGALGELETEVVPLTADMQKWAEAIANGTARVEGTITRSKDFYKAQNLVGKALNDAEKEVNKYADSLGKFEAKTKNMHGTQVKAAKEAGDALKQEIQIFNQMDKTSDKLGDQFNKVQEAAKRFNQTVEGTKAGANVFQNFATRISNAIQQTIAYSLSLGMIYKAQQLLNNAVRYAIDLNTEMTKIQVLQAEGAQTPEQINALAQSFNQLGKEMGASTLEIAKGSVEWFRQGRTVAETQELMRSSLMLSKLGAMESADATNYLTSITNAFRISSEDAVSVVDKLIAVDNIAATSAGELATAMRYTSESAAIAGVSMEQLVSYIGTVSTVTRQNAEMIGQAFKTMFARMTQIQGGGVDETGVTISKVEAALAKVNVEVRNADGSFRNMGNVLEETAAQWSTLTDREQIEIATAVAGVRQKEAFLVLMDNMDKALTYQAAQTDAAGLAQERYGIYLESVEAKQAKLNATMQELYSKTINSDAIKRLLDLATAIVQLTSDIGGMLPVLSTFIGLYLAFNKALLVQKFTDITKSFLNLKDSFILAASFIGKLTGATTINTAQTVANTVANTANTVSQTAKNVSKIAATTATISNTTAQTANNIAVGQAVALGEANAEIELAEIQATLSHEKALVIDTNAQIANNAAKAAGATAGAAAAGGITAMGGAAAGASGAIAGLASALSIVGIVLTVAMGIFMVWNKVQADHKKKIEEATKAIEDYSDRLAEIPSKTKTVTDLFGEIQKLETKKKSGPLSTEDAEQLVSYYSQLSDILPDLPWHYLNGQPFLDMTEVSLGTIIDKINELKYATDEEKQSFDTFMKDKEEGYQEDVVRYNKEIERRKYLEKINDLYLAAEKERLGTGAQAVTDYMASFSNSDIWNSLTESQQSAIDELRENFANLPEGMDESSWKTQWKQLFDDTITSLGKDSDTIKAAQDQFYALFSAGWDASAGQLKPWLQDFLGDAVNSAFVQDIVNRIKRDVALALSSQSMIGTGDTGWTAKYEAEQIRLNQIYIDQRKIVTEATDAFLSLQKATEGQSLNSREAEDAAIDWIDKYNKLTNSTLRLSDVMQDGVINLDQIKGLTENTIQSTDAINELSDANSEYADILSSDVITALTAIEDVTSATSVTISYMGNTFVLAEEKYKNLIDDVSGSLWSFVEETGAAITDVNYQQITSAENFKTALELKLLSFGDFIAQLEAQGIAGIDNIIAYLDSAIAHVVGINPYTPMLPKATGGGGGGGGGGGKTPEQIAAEKEIDAIEDKIEALQDQKKALQDQLKDYKDYISAQKESLKRAKEEADFQDELANKHKNLAKIKAQIAMLALDNSEEAQRKRLELEEEAGTQEEDITKDVEDRKYDLQVQALDDLQEKFEKSIDAQIEAIDDIIDKLNEQKDSLQEVASGSGGGGGGGSYKGVGEAAMTLEEQVQWVMDRVKERNEELIKDLGISEEKMASLVEDWILMGLKIDDAALKLENYLKLLEKTPPQWGGITYPSEPEPGPGGQTPWHTGGLVESHHDGNFAGNLMSNEVFAKLLKGEYVSTEGQMNNFLKNILPKIISKSPPELKYPPGGQQNSAGSIDIDINLIVQGSLDKTVLPDLEKSLLRSVNKALSQRGILRTANSFSM